MVRLLHPMAVTLQKEQKAKTSRMDDRLREPLGPIDRDLSGVVLRAQVKWRGKDDVNGMVEGVDLESDGYLLFKNSDLRRLKLSLSIGDKVTKIGRDPDSYEVSLYIVKLEPIAHKGRGAQLVKAHFQDRSPVTGGLHND